MVVADRAAGSQAEPDLRCGFGPVAVIEHEVLFRDRPSLVRRDVATVEAGGDLLVERAIREQISRELFDGKLVKRHVAVEGVNQPFAVRPVLAEVIEVDAVGVGIAGGVEPVAAPVLAPVLGLHQLVDELLVDIRGRVVHELLDELRRGRQASDVEAEAAGERSLIRFRGGSKPHRFQLSEHECINRVLHPRGILHRGKLRTLCREERPVRLILGPFGNPAAKRFLLGGSQFLLRFRRRHPLVGIVRVNPRNQRTFFWLAGDDGRHLHGHLAAVEPQVPFAGGAVGSVASKAILRQDGADVPVVFELVGCGSLEGSGSQGRDKQDAQGKLAYHRVVLM